MNALQSLSARTDHNLDGLPKALVTSPPDPSLRETSSVIQGPLQWSSSITDAPLVSHSFSLSSSSVPIQDRPVRSLGLSPASPSIYQPRFSSHAGGSLNFHCERLARREKKFATFDERYLAREERVAIFKFEVQSLQRQNQALRQNVTRINANLTSHTTEVTSITICLADQERQVTKTPAELLAFTAKRDRYHCLLRSLTHHFDYMKTVLDCIIAEARSGLSSIQQSVAPHHSEFQAGPYSESEAP